MSSSPTSAAESWSEAEILSDATVCLKWTTNKVESLTKDREARLKALSDRLDADRERARALVENVKKVEYFQKRFVVAHRRAEDEDRWPLIFSDQKFDKRQAGCIIGRLGRYLDERHPLVAAYQTAEERFNAQLDKITGDLGTIMRLRERVELAFKRVSLTQGLEVLAEMRRAGAEALALMEEVAVTTDGGRGLRTRRGTSYHPPTSRRSRSMF